MTTKWPSSCFGAVSRIHSLHHIGTASTKTSYTLRISAIAIPLAQPSIRQYATQQPPKPSLQDLDRHEKAALVEIQGFRPSDPINPPRSTLPPPLNIPEKVPGQFLPIYYFKIGRAYGSFYWRGIKAVWFNRQASKLVRDRIAKNASGTALSKLQMEKKLELMKRSEFQLLARDSYDIGKLPFFGLLVMLFGEWLPLLVPFIPGAVPGTCRIPKQIEGMRRKSEERRKHAFRMGVQEPEISASQEKEGEAKWPLLHKDKIHDMVIKLKDEQLFHLSSTLNLHNRIWDRVQLPPPAVLLRRAITKHLGYLAADDYLLLRDGSGKEKETNLHSQEVFAACEERGVDVLGKSEETLRKELAMWLERQSEDQGRGGAVLTMLFRRPNAWITTKRIAGK